MNWCKRDKDRNWDNVMFSNDWTFYLKASGGMRWVMKNEQYVVPKTKYTHKINCWEKFSEKGKVDLYFFNRNLDTNLYIEILKFSLPEMNKIMKNSVTLQFDNDPKHKSLKALTFYKENNIKIIDWPSNSRDLNSIENILADIKNKL